MSTREKRPGADDGPLVRDLLWIHGILRSNLATISDLIEQVISGTPAPQVQAQIKELSATSLLWSLRAGCIRYCGFVHGHHHHEDVALFPGLRRVNPALCPVIDRLEADHLLVSGYLDAVEAAAGRIVHDEAARPELAQALRVLAEHLLTHLDYEEANLTPTLRQLTTWPWG